MSHSIPLLHIIFYLAIQFMPQGVKQFTIDGGPLDKTTFVRSANDSWEGGDNASIDFSVKGSVVYFTAYAKGRHGPRLVACLMSLSS